MKNLKNLKAEEEKEINGGGILGGNDSANSGSLTGNLGIGNLLSAESHTQDGDESSSSSFSVGNDINSDLGGMTKSLKD